MSKADQRGKQNGETYVGANSSTPWRLALNSGIRTQSTRAESTPELAEVLATGQDLISLDDSIPGVEERRSARLQLHSVQDQLDDQRVAVLGNQGLLLAG